MLKLIKQTKVQVLIFGLIIFLFYGNTLTNGFVHDDVWQVQTNKNIKSIQSIPKIFSGCIGEDLVGKCSERGYYYRPLQNISYLITYQVSDAPWVFHLANLILLFILACLIFNFFKILLATWKVAFLGTMIFLINPIISEVVNWVSAVPELLMSIFIISSLIFAFKFNKSAKITQFVLSLVFLFLALLSKETAVFLSPLVLVVLSLNFKFQISNFKFFSPRLVKFLLVFFVPLVLYFVIRSLVLGRVVYEYEGYYAMSGFEQILNGFYFYGKYILKLILPLPLSFQELILPVKAATPGVAAGILLGMINVSFIFWFYKKGLRILSFALLMINLSFLPALVFINKIGEFLFSERYLFIPAVGFSLLVVEIIRLVTNFKFKFTHREWKHKYFKYFLLGALGIFIAFSWFIVFNRNKDWKDNFASYQAMLRIDSANKKAHFQLGNIYFQKGQIKLAKEEYQQALEIDKNYQEASAALNNISNYFKNKNLSFYYSKAWELKNKSGQISLVNGKDTITISLEGIQDDKEYGTLVNQGEALIPDVDRAYVKVWNPPAGGQVFQFFLFKGSRVLTIIVDPASEDSLNAFNNMVSTLKIR